MFHAFIESQPLCPNSRDEH